MAPVSSSPSPTPSASASAEALAVQVVGDGWATAGDVFTVIAGVAATLGLAFTGYQLMRANQREDAREHGRARRVGLEVSWPTEGGFATPWVAGVPDIENRRWLFTLEAKVVNGNDTSITDVVLSWRSVTDPELAPVLWPSKTIGVVLPHAEAPLLTAEIQVDITKMPAPYRDWTSPWDDRDVFDQSSGGYHNPGMIKWDRVAHAFAETGEAVLSWELDGVNWERTDRQGVQALHQATLQRP